MNSLIGLWVTDPLDEESLAEYGEATLRFEPAGQLTYTIHQNRKKQIMLLTYRVEGNTLVIDQPSEPHEERVPFEITGEGKLCVFSKPVPSTYVRASPEVIPAEFRTTMN